MSILHHPQIGGEIHRFLTGNPNTSLTLRLVSRSVGTYVTSWMVEELFEYVLSGGNPTVRPQFLGDLLLGCAQKKTSLQAVPLTHNAKLETMWTSWRRRTDVTFLHALSTCRSDDADAAPTANTTTYVLILATMNGESRAK